MAPVLAHLDRSDAAGGGRWPGGTFGRQQCSRDRHGHAGRRRRELLVDHQVVTTRDRRGMVARVRQQC
ncbi:hypothetical protein KHF85_04785 [Xanthomonas translucens pv. graminis]|uniref:hypothetical protein n=1 Tax=Xanthomonas graminis TaxID=3390026 RepID=UPI00254260A5|nr:hypothetical protein [Xanthomonas translucens]WIH05794.1 hypothetical protein KHF85_04785 [Xanthomonas translucens pv. graminis]